MSVMSRHSVFSAQAEVFLFVTLFAVNSVRFLRASGGVSKLNLSRLDFSPFSPRKRRCFYRIGCFLDTDIVFSAQAEVFPINGNRAKERVRFLRASGGVSRLFVLPRIVMKFSPRKRRCFL